MLARGGRKHIQGTYIRGDPYYSSIVTIAKHGDLLSKDGEGNRLVGIVGLNAGKVRMRGQGLSWSYVCWLWKPTNVRPSQTQQQKWI